MTTTDRRWGISLALTLLASVNCGAPAAPSETRQGRDVGDAVALSPGPASGESTRLSHIFDDATARELMRLRLRFDEAELAAIREFDAALGSGRVQIGIPAHHYERQLGTREVGEYPWTPEQKRRAAAAWPMRQEKIDEAEAVFSVRTATVLKPFGFKEDRLPPIRRRKWDGPAVHGFDSFRGDVPKASHVLLQEVRRLWNLSARVRP